MLRVFFSELVDLRKQNKNKFKKFIHRFLDIATYKTCAKFQGKTVNPTLDGAPGSPRFLNKRHCFFGKNRSLSNITHLYFSMQDQCNQTITKFVLKSNIQDIRKP